MGMADDYHSDTSLASGDTHQRHMPETDALGLDYCISTPEVQLIQSQPIAQ